MRTFIPCEVCGVKHRAVAICAGCGHFFCQNGGANTLDGLLICQDCPHDRVDWDHNPSLIAPRYIITSHQGIEIYRGHSEINATIAMRLATLAGLTFDVPHMRTMQEIRLAQKECLHGRR